MSHVLNVTVTDFPRYCCSFRSPAPEVYVTSLLGATELEHHHQPWIVLSNYTHLVPIPPD